MLTEQMFDLFAYGGKMCGCGDSSTLGNFKKKQQQYSCLNISICCIYLVYSCPKSFLRHQSTQNKSLKWEARHRQLYTESTKAKAITQGLLQ